MSQKSSNKQCSLPSILSNIKPSQILPFLYVGCQEDALSIKTMQDNYITHVINVSTTGEKARFLNENDDEHFLRIPVNDCHNAQLLPYFDQAYTFIEKARLNNGRVFIHCLAGISRSPTLAIAYIMRYLHLSADDAYQHVKQRRSQISPNFNFLGQLSAYEHSLSVSSIPTDIPTTKCLKIETPLIDRRRFIQVETNGSDTDNSIKDRTNAVSRPTCLSFDLNNGSRSLSSTTHNLSIEPPQQQSSLTKTSLRPNSISLKRPTLNNNRSTLGLVNSSCDDLTNNKRVETVPKSADIPSLNEHNDLINTYFQDSTILPKPLQQCKPVQSADATNETTPSPRTNVSSSSLEVLVL